MLAFQFYKKCYEKDYQRLHGLDLLSSTDRRIIQILALLYFEIQFSLEGLYCWINRLAAFQSGSRSIQASIFTS